MSDEKIVRIIAIVLLTTILINPIGLFVASGDIITTLICFFVSVALVLVTYLKLSQYSIHIYAIYFLTAVSILLHAEIIFTTQFKEYIIENLYYSYDKYYFNKPYLKNRFVDKEFSVDYVTNNQGFRIGLEDNQETTIGEVDWLFLGDSFTQGAQVNFEQLYTSRLYKNFPDKIILNSGISGWGIPEEYYYYKEFGHQFRAKKVFLQICNFNDFMNVEERHQSFSDVLMNHSEFVRYLLYPYKYANPAELPLGRWTEPFYPDRKDNEDYNIFFKNKSPKQKEFLKRFEEYLILLNNEVIKNGAQLIVFQIPTKEQLYYRYFEEVIQSYHVNPKDLDMDFPSTFLSSICRVNAIVHLDLTQELGALEREIFYQYDEHLNEFGHDRVSTIISNHFDSLKNPNGAIKLLSEYNTEDRYPIQYDSNLITFQSVRDSNIELFISDSAMRNTHRITFNDIDELHPCLNTKSNKILFTEGDQVKGETKIGIMDLAGTGRYYITKENAFGAIPFWNQSGTKITYAKWISDSSGNKTQPYIVVDDLEKQTQSVITSSEYENWRPIFSPDDRFLFYISKRATGNFDIYRYDFSSQTEKNITNTSYDEWDVAISKDGGTIVYAANKNDNWDLFFMDLDTMKSVQLTNSLGDEWDPSFGYGRNDLLYAGTFGFMNGVFKMKVLR